MIQGATPEQVRQITRDVLTRPEFQERFSWTQLVTKQIWRWLRELAAWSQAHPGSAKVVLVVLAMLLVALLVHLAYTAVREFASLRKAAVNHRRGGPLPALDGVAENWGEAFQLARAALEAGNLYRAIWITHRILLSALDRMDRVKFARWKTNTDYLRECREADAASATLVEVTAAYERVIYAHDEFDRRQAARLLTQVEALAGEAAR